MSRGGGTGHWGSPNSQHAGTPRLSSWQRAPHRAVRAHLVPQAAGRKVPSPCAAAGDLERVLSGLQAPCATTTRSNTTTLSGAQGTRKG